jgi:YolD-like protein
MNHSPFLIPEHRKMLKELREKEERIQSSCHDEQQYQEWNRIIVEAVEFASYLSIQYIHNYRLCCVIGRVHYYDQLNQTLRFKEKDSEKIHYIHVPSIKEIKIAPSSP